MQLRWSSSVIVLLLLFNALFVFESLKCREDMKKSFCDALEANDRDAIQKDLNNFLRDLSYKAEREQNFEKIKRWIESKECVASVETSTYLVDTDPPIKEFVVNLRKSTKTITIGIVLKENGWLFHKK
jgi:uncharacterized membrane protein YvbJ